MQVTPAGFPWGSPGMGDEMEIAIQQAPHPIRQVNPSELDTERFTGIIIFIFRMPALGIHRVGKRNQEMRLP